MENVFTIFGRTMISTMKNAENVNVLFPSSPVRVAGMGKQIHCKEVLYWMSEAAIAIKENRRLRRALRKYGEHRPGCALDDENYHHMGCTCGLDKALRGKGEIICVHAGMKKAIT
jgi:hypothetical protein